MSLLVLGSAVAFSALISLSVAALYSSYLLVCILLLWRRLTGGFSRMDSLNPIFKGSDRLDWGPWHVSEPWGTFINALACIYLCFIWFWSFWPPATPTTPQNANFSILVFGAVVLGCVLWYSIRAKHTFRGPVREID
jgi:choline transport protein